jgi:hypothetical protein
VILAGSQTIVPDDLPSRPSRLLVAGQTALVVCTVTSLLLTGSRLGAWIYPTLFGVPLVVTAVRRDGSFRLWSIYAVSFVLFVQLRAVADDVGTPVRIEYPIVVDRLLGLGELPTVRLQSLGAGLAWPAIVIHLSYYVVPPVAGILLQWLAPDRFRPYMLAISAAYLIGLAIHFLVPTAPPWMAAQLGRSSPVARYLYDVLHTQNPSFYRYGSKVAAGNEVAAMPSLHMAAAWLVMLATSRTRVAGAGVLYALAMGLALVYTGEHYVVDELAGMALAWVTWTAFDSQVPVSSGEARPS